MSDEFERLVDIDVSLEDAPAVGKQVVERLRELKLISGGLNKKCVLGGSGYLPGPAVPTSYQHAKGDYKFWELQVCGVEPLVGRHFNYWALGEAFEGSTCPACGEVIDPFDEVFSEALSDAVGEWSEQSGKALVACPACKKKNPVTKWICQPPLGFGNLSFSFWNWPALVKEITVHTIVRSYGHV
jgi:hypothetical protein